MDESDESTGSATFFVDMLCGGVVAIFTLILLLSVVGASAPPPALRGPLEIELETDPMDKPPPRIGLICVSPTNAQYAVLGDTPGLVHCSEFNCDLVIQSGVKKDRDGKYIGYLNVKFVQSYAGTWQFKPYIVEQQSVPTPTSNAIEWLDGKPTSITITITGSSGGKEGKSTNITLSKAIAGASLDTVATMVVP